MLLWLSWEVVWGFQSFLLKEQAPRDSVLALETSSLLGTELLKIIELARISQELCYPSTVPGQMPNCGVQVRVKTPGSVRCRSDCCQVPRETA